MDSTKRVIQNYWDYRSESYNNGVIERSEEERNAWKQKSKTSRKKILAI